ncbi:aspartate ammonia-lyase [Candidatus Woesebacteria bacterium]|nr:aspartate ammonia-lyase [Candidatus Woesebacteria bacterium]
MKTYYGTQTKQALENFPFKVPSVSLDLIYAITEIKKASALSHGKMGELDTNITSPIVTACDEILSGKHDDQFPVSSLQGGAGTSINMNVNEVIAQRASEISGITIHPNDHVNRSQSTNDVNPTALRIVALRLSQNLIDELHLLSTELSLKEKAYKSVPKLARTHMQDAIPTTVGAEIGAWRATIDRDIRRLSEFLPYLRELHIGGTAIGNCLNASGKYQKEIFVQLNILLKEWGPFTPAPNFHSFTSTTSDFVHLQNLITLSSGNLSKIAHDIRFLSSGPRGGIGEYRLAPLQPGSSIMPGKVNPVIPEVMNQIYYHISGKNLAVQMANETSDLQLAVMFPTVADALITSFSILTTGVHQFSQRCIKLMKINEKQCHANLEKTTATATALTLKLGYDAVAEMVKKEIEKKA